MLRSRGEEGMKYVSELQAARSLHTLRRYVPHGPQALMLRPTPCAHAVPVFQADISGSGISSIIVSSEAVVQDEAGIIA